MQVTETHAEGLKREFKITVDSGEIDEKVQDRLKEIGKDARIPGFRPGRAPISILRQRFGQAVLGEVLERAVNDSSQQALQERGLRPAQQPQIEVESFDQGKDLEYRMSMELLPDIEPMDFSQLELEKLKVKVPEEEVEQALQRLADQMRETKPVEEERPAQKGDVLVIDFQGTVDGEAYPGMEAEDHHLELGANAFIEGFEDQLIGAAPGEEREVTVTFPEAYGNEALAGKEAVFKVKVKELREPVATPIDDELAKKVGLESVDELRNTMRERIEQDYERLARTRTKRQLLDKLADAHTFDVPPSMLESEFDQIWQQVEHDREHGRLDPEDQDKSEDELKADYRRIAERRVRLGLLLSEVGRQNNIQVNDDELSRALMEEVKRYPGQEREVFDYYQNHPDALAALRAPVYEDKVIDYIMELGQVSEREITVDELQKELQDETGAASGGAADADAAAAGGQSESSASQG